MSLARTARLLDATKPEPFGKSLSPFADAVLDNAFGRLAAEHAKFRAQLRAIEKGA